MNKKGFKQRSLGETLELFCRSKGGQFLRGNKLNRSYLAKLAGASQASMTRWLANSSSARSENISKLAKALKLHPSQVRGETPIPGIDYAESVDDPSTTTPVDEYIVRTSANTTSVPLLIPEEFESWPEDLSDSENWAAISLTSSEPDFAITVENDAVSIPGSTVAIPPGATVFIKRSENGSVESGSLALIAPRQGGGAMLRQVFTEGEKAIYKPTNPAYTTYSSDTHRAIGQVVGVYILVE